MHSAMLDVILYLRGHSNHRITPSNATSAAAFAGNARRQHGTKPRQNPFMPPSRQIASAASLQRGYLRFPASRSSVMIRCFTTSVG